MAPAEIWGWIGAIIGLLGYLPYGFQIITDPNAQPDRPSWAIWTMEYGVLTLALIALDTPIYLLAIPGLQLIGVLVIFGFSIRWGTGAFNAKQYVLLGCVGAAMAARFFVSPSVAIMLLIVVEATGVVCTAIKVYNNPRSEPLLFWWCVIAAGAAGLLAVTPGSPLVMHAYPGSLVCMGLTIVGTALVRRQHLQAVLQDAQPAQ